MAMGSSQRPDSARRTRRIWWILLALGALFVLMPFVLWTFVTLPPAVMLLPIWTFGVGLWLFMRALDKPATGEPGGTAAAMSPTPPARPERIGNVISLDEVRLRVARRAADRRAPGRQR